VKGDCLTCSKIDICSKTSVEKVLNSFTCILFEPISEPVYRARVTLMEQYGEVPAVVAMLKRPPQFTQEGEE
jgi:hypothetical protein